eukprot:CAMPEP_0206379524 /NCGR_PEP_ID=MMETSP0294-20121207/11415_1 /ASSEMBLY_ACC=CAM_ASM_000327 /TAXON_ID=39354 /ORGANISM="Heterosigma akashiwo, Strain CCMP2393" /LENGTH=38 /DNA_ID= /DNA_START= /DNA_END= /DNA_ORIENTATION=
MRVVDGAQHERSPVFLQGIQEPGILRSDERAKVDYCRD